MKQFVLAIAVAAFCVMAAVGQASTNADPGKAKFVTSDIDNFWRAFDMAREEPDFEKRVAIYQAKYLDKGSVGLKDFIRLRIKDAKTLTTMVDTLPWRDRVRPPILQFSSRSPSLMYDARNTFSRLLSLDN